MPAYFPPLNVPASNILLNGAMDLDQAREGASVVVPPDGVSPRIGPDGWAGLASADTAVGTTTIQRVADAPAGSTYSLKFTAGTGGTVGGGVFAQLYQAVTVADSLPFNWGTANARPVTVSGFLKASVAGQYSVCLQNAVNYDRAYVHMVTVAANTWTPFSFTAAGDTAGTWTGQVEAFYLNVFAFGTVSTSNLDVWQAGSTIGTNQVQYQAGATLQITNMKIEIGATPTPFDHGNFADLLARAQTRYAKTFPQGVAPAQNAGVAGALCVKNPIAIGDPSIFWQWPDMVMAPAITTYNPSAANANWRNITAAADVAVAVDPGSALSSSSGVLIATSATVTTLGDILAIHAVRDASLL